MSSIIERTEGASPRGYHFTDAYRSCKRAWAVKYLLGLEPEFSKPPLVVGKAIHSWQELYFKHRFLDSWHVEECSRDAEMNAIFENIPRMSFFEEAEWTEAKQNARKVCIEWAVNTEDDFSSYRPLLVEEELYMPLKVRMRSGDAIVELTGRVDRLFEHRPSETLLLIDAKSTSGRRVEYVQSTNEAQDQFVHYSALVMQRFNRMPSVCIDVCSWKPVKFERTEEFLYAQSDIEDYLDGLSGTWSDLIQSVELWEEELVGESTNPSSLERFFHELFPRSPGRCAYFGCEYAEFCRGIKDLSYPRPGFVQYRPITTADLFEKHQDYEGGIHE